MRITLIWSRFILLIGEMKLIFYCEYFKHVWLDHYLVEHLRFTWIKSNYT